MTRRLLVVTLTLGLLVGVGQTTTLAGGALMPPEAADEERADDGVASEVPVPATTRLNI
jgi:hypothetical protein